MSAVRRLRVTNLSEGDCVIMVLKSSLVGGVLFAGALAASAIGCASPPEEEEPQAVTHGALGQDPNNCSAIQHYRELRCTFPPGDPFANEDLRNYATQLAGDIGCGTVIAGAVEFVGGLPTVVVSLWGAAQVVGAVTSCALYLDAIRAHFFDAQCSVYDPGSSDAVFSRKRNDRCAMACSTTYRIASNGDCYCAAAVNPLACSEGSGGGGGATTTPPGPSTPGTTPTAPSGVATPPPNTCINRGHNNEAVPRGQCTSGYTNGVANSVVYKCNSSGQDWQQCRSTITVDQCNRGTCL